VDNLFPALFDDLATGNENCCGAVCPNLKVMSCDFGRKTQELKQDDIEARWGRCDHNTKVHRVQIHSDKIAPTTSKKKLQI